MLSIRSRQKWRLKNMEFYLVTTKCGHVGKGHYVPITFPIKAENGKEAAKIARMLPRVKHHHWDAILKCEKVTAEEYMIQLIKNACDPYLHVRSKKEQRELVEDIESRLVVDNHQDEINKPRYKKCRPNLKYQAMKYSKYYEDNLGE